jgi:hypothetical protein
VILNLLTESVRQTGEPANRHANRQVMPLDKAGVDVLWVWVAGNGVALASKARAVALLAVVPDTLDLHRHRVVHVATKRFIIERQNLSIRMGMCRMTRLTNASSKRCGNLWYADCLWFAFYNFCRVHRTLRVTPAMEAGFTDRICGIENLESPL